MRRSIFLSVTLALIVTSDLFPQEKGRRQARPPCQPQQAAFQQVFALCGLESSGEQRKQPRPQGRSRLPVYGVQSRSCRFSRRTTDGS